VIIDTGRVFENATRGLVSIYCRNGRMTSCGKMPDSIGNASTTGQRNLGE
jgi:hypothetical protein